MTTPTIITRIKFEGLDEIKAAFDDIQKSWAQTTDRMRRSGEKVGEGLKKSIDASTSAVKTTGTVGVRSFSLLKSAAAGFMAVLKGGVSLLVNLGRVALDVAGKIAAVGAGAFVAVQAFGIKTGQAIDDMGRLADAAGIPVERFSRLATATRLLGGDISDLGSGMQTLSERIFDAAKDADGAGAKAFAQLGISVRDSNGHIKSTEQVLYEVADALARVPRDSLRASAATDLFGGSARALLPILERGADGLEQYAREADKLGTVVTEQQSKTARGLLVQYRKVAEALRGIAYRIADHLLPFLTQNSNAISSWLAENNDRVAAFAGRVLREIAGISADLGRAIIGDAAAVEREWVRKLIPAMHTVRDVLLDLLDLFSGGRATRAPWLRRIGDALRDAGASALALLDGLRKAAGFGEAKLPSLEQAADAVAEAFANLRAGITGKGEVTMPWAANVGETMRNVAAAIGIVAAVIVEHREEITGFAADFTRLLTEAMSAVKSLLSGDEIAAGNPFAFLQAWKDSAMGFYEEMVDNAIWLRDQVVSAYEGIKPVLETLWTWFDSLAQTLGFNSGAELGILLVVAEMTGLLKVAQTLATAFAAISLTVNNFLGAVVKVGQIGVAVFRSAIIPAVTALATALGLPVAAVGAIVAAIVALAAAVWYWWDDIKAACEWLWDAVKAGFDAMLEAVLAVWEGISGAAEGAWGKVVSLWEGFTDWIASLFDGAMSSVRAFWDWMASAPGRAWDALADTWSGFTDFFSSLVGRVRDYFKGLWDGVKNGARDAWNNVKGWFGFGDEGTPEEGSADRSPRLATGGIIRGPGGPVGDRIRAWLSDGEGVLNAKAVSHYGEGLVHALNNLLVPKTHFATGGIVGQMVPAASGAGLGALHLAIDGRNARGGFYADADAMRMLRRDFRSVAIASRGRLPRWRGA